MNEPTAPCGTRPCGTRDQEIELERRLADLEARLPRHSVPPALLQELEDLEEELDHLRRQKSPRLSPDPDSS